MTHTPQAFVPARGLRSGHAQTLYPALFRKQPTPKIKKERFELQDGDFVECFWHNIDEDREAQPIVILFHGLEGSFYSPYIQGVMHSLAGDGFASVIMHFRGCSGVDNRLPSSYHSAKTDDAKHWIKEVAHRYPNSQLFAIGYSLGGNMLLNLLAECRHDTSLTAAISISAPLQLDICADTIDNGFSKIYQKYLMRHLKTSLLNKYKSHDMQRYIGISQKEVKKLRTFWEFDDIYTAKINGFGNANNYYKKASAKQYLKQIVTPTLIIHALDDPFMTPDILPKRSEISSAIELEVYPHGGHVGFISGTITKPEYWLDRRVSRFFLGYILPKIY